MVTTKELIRAFGQARRDLAEAGLLASGEYLDVIDCARVRMVWDNDLMGYVYTKNTWKRVFGFKAGRIFIPTNAPVRPRQPGMTLADVVRHEFGHAWEWLDSQFFAEPWFRRAFGAEYDDEWDEEENPAWCKLVKRSARVFRNSQFHEDYVSGYALVAPKEDFAETFMFYLRYRDDLEQFRDRPGVYRKLRAVEKAVKRKATELGLESDDVIIHCPVDDEEVAVPEEDDLYVCPTCGLEIVVADGTAKHAEVLTYVCPDSVELHWVPAEPGETFVCCGCGLDALVDEDEGYLKVLHQLRLED